LIGVEKGEAITIPPDGHPIANSFASPTREIVLTKEMNMQTKHSVTDSIAQRREFGRAYPPQNDWLARQEPEPILEPAIPIVDTQYHIMDRAGFRYLAADVVRDISTGHRIEAMVFTECHFAYRSSGPEALRPVGETEGVMLVSAADSRLGTGIVGYADLMLGAAVEEVLVAHVEAGAGRFKGIRYGTALDPSPSIEVHHRTSPGVMGHSAFSEGVNVLEKMGLSFDALVFFHQLGEVVALAQDHPGLNIVLGHCGGLLGYGPWAGRSEEVFRQWRANLLGVARCPNVSIKLGGILMRLAAYDYLNIERPESSQALADCLRRYIMTCIELFGPDRCMFESNYPVDSAATGYLVLWNTFKRITADLSAAEKLSAYSSTARRVYRLG
jgi:L-fuconolactonase